jgi:hypothetical protein
MPVISRFVNLDMKAIVFRNEGICTVGRLEDLTWMKFEKMKGLAADKRSASCWAANWHITYKLVDSQEVRSWKYICLWWLKGRRNINISKYLKPWCSDIFDYALNFARKFKREKKSSTNSFKQAELCPSSRLSGVCSTNLRLDTSTNGLN